MIKDYENIYISEYLTIVNKVIVMEQETKEIKAQLITKDMTIGDVVAKYPACIETLQAAGGHCVGCHVSYHETLNQNFKKH